MGRKISLSLELICLLKWLSEHDDKLLRQIVKKAMKEGLAPRLASLSEDEYRRLGDRFGEIVIDFTVLLESIMNEEYGAQLPRLGSQKKIEEEALKQFLLDWKPSQNETIN